MHGAGWPYARLAELTTAHAVNRAYAQMAASPATVVISKTDPAVTNDVLRLGNFLVIESDEVEPWIGRLLAVNETSAGAFELAAKSWEDVLSTATHGIGGFTLQGLSPAKHAKDVLIDANQETETGVRPPAVTDQGTRMTTTSGAAASGTVLVRLQGLATVSGEEWWLEVTSSPRRLTATLRWGTQGRDHSGALHLWEGAHFVQVEHLHDIAGLTPQVRLVTEPRRVTQQAPELSQGSNVEADRFALRVNGLVDWRLLGIGDVITVHAVTGLGQVTRRVRITGLKPDEERGELGLLNEVVG
jgi:hypothetical protein